MQCPWPDDNPVVYLAIAIPILIIEYWLGKKRPIGAASLVGLIGAIIGTIIVDFIKEDKNG